MKKALTLFLSSAFVLSLTACSNSNTASSANVGYSAADTVDSSSNVQTSADSTENGTSEVSSDNEKTVRLNPNLHRTTITAAVRCL